MVRRLRARIERLVRARVQVVQQDVCRVVVEVGERDVGRVRRWADPLVTLAQGFREEIGGCVVGVGVGPDVQCCEWAGVGSGCAVSLSCAVREMCHCV
jgi:hypothetical protein